MAQAGSLKGVAKSPVAGPTDFYREEFLRHRECLARQREYFSERAITEAEAALSRVLGNLDQLCATDDGE